MNPDPPDRDERQDAPDDDAAEAEEGGEAPREDRTGDDGEEEERRPISVRDLMPAPSTRPSRRSAERGEGRGREVDEEEAEGSPRTDVDGEEPADATVSDEGGEAEGETEGGEEPQAAASVPTPVRVAMDAPPPGDSRPPEELPSRRFEVDGAEWIVRISGRTITGTRPDSGALLMHLSFFRPAEPETPVRALVTVDRPLDVLYDEDLRELLERSRPAELESAGSPEG